MTLVPSTSSGGGALSGVTVTGTAAAGQVPVASSSSAGAWGYPPGYEVGYDQITANVTISASSESAGTTVITCSAHTFDGGLVVVEFFSPLVQCATGDNVTVCLFESTTEIGRLAAAGGGTGVADYPVVGRIRFTPSAAAHTYTVTAFRGAANGIVAAGLGGTAAYAPAFVRFTKV